MTLLQLFSNNAIAILRASISSSDTSIEVQAGLGALYPRPVNPGEFFLVTLESIAPPLTREIIKIIGVSGDTLLVGQRGMEGTASQAWPANTTLVDHRITAETIKQAFLQPLASNTNTGSGGIITPSVPVPASTVEGISTTPYSDTARMNKFWIQMYDPVTGNAQALEIFTIIHGILSTNAEVADYVQSQRIGYNFLGSVQINLNVLNKTLTLQWHNQSTSNIIVTVTRI